MKNVSRVVAAAALLSCFQPPRTVPLPVLPFAADTARADRVNDGVTHWYFHVPSGPWAIHALVVDRDKCYSAVAMKGADGAAGRKKTSLLLDELSRSSDVAGGINADFFVFTPPGVPQNLLISRGRLIAGPSPQPVLAFDSLGAPHITVFRVEGSETARRNSYAILAWNHPAPFGIALYDRAWAALTDTLSNSVEVVLDGSAPARVISIDTTAAGVAIPRDGAVLVGRGRDARSALLSLHIGDSVRTSVALRPFHPMEAVGGRPVLLRDSAIVAEVDTLGGKGFATTRHPRSAVGVAREGRRLLLVVVDGRQKPYSDGMTLRELATLMRALGARDAINLDGGGSTTLVYADPAAGGKLRIANHPSDSAGERPVGDALAIVRGCASGR
jgi:hypothetical protein